MESMEDAGAPRVTSSSSPSSSSAALDWQTPLVSVPVEHVDARSLVNAFQALGVKLSALSESLTPNTLNKLGYCMAYEPLSDKSGVAVLSIDPASWGEHVRTLYPQEQTDPHS